MSVFLGLAQTLNNLFPFIKLSLIHSGSKKDPREYLADAIKKTLIFFVLTVVVLLVLLLILGIKEYWIIVIVSLAVSMFFFFSRIITPSVKAGRRIRSLEKNLLPALQSVFVQINSGIPLFEVLTNISRANYGEVSREFTKAVNKINAGKSQVESLEEMVVENPSIFFRRAIWQVINGMKSGADLSNTIEQTLNLLAEEKILQIQNYGARLSPLAMFYMLIGIILPALSIIFIILMISIMNLSLNTAMTIFLGVFIFIVFFQILFLGLINMRRPSLV